MYVEFVVISYFAFAADIEDDGGGVRVDECGVEHGERGEDDTRAVEGAWHHEVGDSEGAGEEHDDAEEEFLGFEFVVCGVGLEGLGVYC